ncbi:lipase 1-like isoform X1 [Cataglyphis hispanica]|uniref:lipase 1-like isoform X1 n=1 Tax=Cataglyphis hispanica TaxID=1086592 RepID=UPI0021806239|nr:lipase 1-like isoform X1 [Cataglyphis hispanica]
MRLIGIVYLLSFYNRLDTASANITPESSMFMRTSQNELNNTELNPDVDLNTLEVIRRAGYPVEAHVITMEDGYLLTLHRIPGGHDSLPVLLQHGLFSNSAQWVVLDKDKALPYLLADQGYDVWLGNFRGNTYSRAHISLSPSDSTFWDFSFNEMGIYDLPATITFITNMRSQSLYTYIGHSMGAASFFIMASERPEIARKVQMMISFAPAVFMNHMESPLQYFVPFTRELKMIMQFFFNGEFLQSDLVKFFFKYVCDENITGEFCSNVLFMMFGQDREQLNSTLLPFILSHSGSETSFKTLVHFAQEVRSGKFRKYDYGRAKNLLIYNSTEPPDYDLANITTPIALFYADNDLGVIAEDVKRLYHLLPNILDMYEVPWSKFNHTLLPVIFSHFPAGGSFDTLVQYVQGFQSNKFRQYDYGSARNLLIYNSVEPADYNLANIMIPIALFYGPGDTLDNIMGVKKLYRMLPNVVDVYEVPWRNFNHVDFIWAKDARKLVYERVLRIMRSENSNNVTSMKKCYAGN